MKELYNKDLLDLRFLYIIENYLSEKSKILYKEDEYSGFKTFDTVNSSKIFDRLRKLFFNIKQTEGIHLANPNEFSERFYSSNNLFIFNCNDFSIELNHYFGYSQRYRNIQESEIKSSQEEAQIRSCRLLFPVAAKMGKELDRDLFKKHVLFYNYEENKKSFKDFRYFLYLQKVYIAERYTLELFDVYF